MDGQDLLAEQFEAQRGHLKAVAYRMLGSSTEADDAVQEAWLRLHRSDANAIENLGGWLTTVVARVCLDMLRSRKSRREDSLGEPAAAATIVPTQHTADPEKEALLADSVGLALLVVLDRLAPAERLAFVLHDMFGVPFEEIAEIVGRSPDATRQLASRARRRVQGGDLAPSGNLDEQRRLVSAFLAALRAGDFQGLVAVLDPDVMVHTDAVAAVDGVSAEVRGAGFWAKQAITAARGAIFARVALVNGSVGLVVAPRGKLFRILRFTFATGKIAQVEVVGDPARLSEFDLAVLENPVA